MLMRFYNLYIVITSILLVSLVNYNYQDLEKIGSSFLAFGMETEHETEEEHAMEKNMNVENGFSPAHSNSEVKVTNNSQVSDLSISGLTNIGSPVYGNLSAPITVVEFGDFQCHFCGRFAKQTEPLLNTTYFQTGKVNFVFKHFVTHGSDSFNAALASQCANDQGKFWNFYNKLYLNQGEENSGWVSVENLKKFASEINGLDKQKFNSCLDNQKHKSLVESDTQFAFESGYQGTPTLIIENSNGENQEVLVGAYPFPALQVIIDKKLSSLGR
jgi:protein-disulfide isomerase